MSEKETCEKCGGKVNKEAEFPIDANNPNVVTCPKCGNKVTL